MNLFSCVNDEVICVETLKMLKDVIDGLYTLSDPYYIEAFNSSDTVARHKPDFTKIAEQLEIYRSLLLGDGLDWKEFIKLLKEV